MSQLLFSLLATILLQDYADCRVIQSHWEHVKFKTLAPARVDARLTGALVLTCSATGSPAPSLAWYKDGLFVYHEPDTSLSSGSSLGETVAKLRMGCVTPEAAGQYECRAVAGLQQISAVTEVKVVPWEEDSSLCQERGQPEISLWRPTLMVEAGDSVSLPCRVSRPDEAIVIWTDARGEAVMKEDRFEVTESGDLRISEVSWADMGEFTCTASNEAGVASVHTFLYPLASTPASHP